MTTGESGQGDLLRLIPEPRERPVKVVLRYLSDYKELLAIVAFVVGGVLWVFGYFVTKSQFAELKCYAKNSIVTNREMIKIRDADEAIIEQSRKLDEIVDKQKTVVLNEQDRKEKVRLEQLVRKLEDGRKVAQEKFNRAQAKLEDSECLGGEEK